MHLFLLQRGEPPTATHVGKIVGSSRCSLISEGLCGRMRQGQSKSGSAPAEQLVLGRGTRLIACFVLPLLGEDPPPEDQRTDQSDASCGKPINSM